MLFDESDFSEKSNTRVVAMNRLSFEQLTGNERTWHAASRIDDSDGQIMDETVHILSSKNQHHARLMRFCCHGVSNRNVAFCLCRSLR